MEKNMKFMKNIVTPFACPSKEEITYFCRENGIKEKIIFVRHPVYGEFLVTPSGEVLVKGDGARPEVPCSFEELHPYETVFGRFHTDPILVSNYEEWLEYAKSRDIPKWNGGRNADGTMWYYMFPYGRVKAYRITVRSGETSVVRDGDAEKRLSKHDRDLKKWSLIYDFGFGIGNLAKAITESEAISKTNGDGEYLFFIGCKWTSFSDFDEHYPGVLCKIN